MENKGYYDIEIELEKMIQGADLDSLLFLKDLKLRKFYLNYDIEQVGIHDIARHILQINAEDRGIPREERKPILLYVISNGGEVDSGFELIDIIESSETPVYTVNLG